MTLAELTTPFESFRVVTYNTDKTKALYKNKQMQLVSGTIYRGETVEEEYNNHCDVYVRFDEIPVGIWINSLRTDYTVEEVVEFIKRKGMDSLENFIGTIRKRLEKQDHFRFTEIEFIKHIAPELEHQMLESKEAHKEKCAYEDRRRKEQLEAENHAYVQTQNTKADQIVDEALNILRNGGRLENEEVTFYESRYNYSSYSVINYLMRKYGVKVPIRTQGWINEKLVSVIIDDNKCERVQYHGAKGAKCSQKIFDCFDELLVAVNG